jgi:hypothetical protein
MSEDERMTVTQNEEIVTELTRVFNFSHSHSLGVRRTHDDSSCDDSK